MKKLLPLLLATLALALSSGCASFRYAKTPPSAPQQIPVKLSGDHPSKMSDFPAGTYYNPESRLAFTGYQKGTGVSMLFGVVGVLVADQANKASGEGKFGQQAKTLPVDFKARTLELLSAHCAESKASRVTLETAGNHTLKVVPYGVMAFNDQQQGRLYVCLKVDLLDQKGESVWSGRYFASAPGLHPYDGEASWNSPGIYATGIDQALKKACWALVSDFEGRFTQKRKVLVKGVWAWVPKPLFELRGLVIDEQESQIVVRMLVGDLMTFAGTHVIDKTDVSLKEGDFSLPEGL